MLSLDTISTSRAFGLGLLVTAINPKELAFTLGAAISIGAAHQPAGGILLLELIYLLMAGSTVITPVLMHVIAPERARSVLGPAQEWVVRNQATVVGVVLLVLGVVLASDGLSYL